MIGHDDMLLDRHHGIVGVDGGEQLVFYHLPYPRQRGAWCIGAAVGGIERAHHSTEGLAQGLCHMHGDVVEAGPRVVMSRRAAGHAVLYGVSHFHFTTSFLWLMI